MPSARYSQVQPGNPGQEPDDESTDNAADEGSTNWGEKTSKVCMLHF